MPCNFRAKFEEHRLLLPSANVVGVHERVKASAAELATVFPAFVVRTSLFATTPPQCKGCEVMGARVVFKSRHSSDQIKAMLAGQWTEHLLGREWLLRVKPDHSGSGDGTHPVEKPAPNAKLVEALASPQARCL